MGLRESVGWGVVAFLLGLVQDSFSGLYLGLNGLSYLIIFLFFSLMADRLYTDRRSLMILGVFTASLASALLILLLLFVFAESRGIYASLIQSMVPQGLVNAFAASLLFTFTPLARMGEPK
jgi:rod shape-determining protein MreD